MNVRRNVHKRVFAQINYRSGYYDINYEFLQAFFVSGWFGAFSIFLILYFTHFVIIFFLKSLKIFLEQFCVFFLVSKLRKIDTIKIGDS